MFCLSITWILRIKLKSLLAASVYALSHLLTTSALMRTPVFTSNSLLVPTDKVKRLAIWLYLHPFHRTALLLKLSSSKKSAGCTLKVIGKLSLPASLKICFSIVPVFAPLGVWTPGAVSRGQIGSGQIHISVVKWKNGYCDGDKRGLTLHHWAVRLSVEVERTCLNSKLLWYPKLLRHKWNTYISLTKNPLMSRLQDLNTIGWPFCN